MSVIWLIQNRQLANTLQYKQADFVNPYKMELDKNRLP